MSLINSAIDAAVPPTHDVAQLIELRHPRVWERGSKFKS